MFQVFDVKGNVGGECYLLLFEKCSVLLDSGFDFCVERTAENVKEKLGGRKLDLILLTHSHYDHVSGAAYLKKVFPEARVAAGEYAADVFRKESARKVMREFNGLAAKRNGVETYEDHLDLLAADETARPGDAILLPGITIRAIEACGHTKCSLCFYVEEEELLISCETIGIMFVFPEVLPGNVVGYASTVDAIERARALRPKHILAPHHGMIPNGGADVYFARAMDAVTGAKELVTADFEKGMRLEEIIEHCKREYYTKECAVMQPMEAFIVNTKYMIVRTLGESGLGFPEAGD